MDTGKINICERKDITAINLLWDSYVFFSYQDRNDQVKYGAYEGLVVGCGAEPSSAGRGR